MILKASSSLSLSLSSSLVTYSLLCMEKYQDEVSMTKILAISAGAWMGAAATSWAESTTIVRRPSAGTMALNWNRRINRDNKGLEVLSSVIRTGLVIAACADDDSEYYDLGYPLYCQ